MNKDWTELETKLNFIGIGSGAIKNIDFHFVLNTLHKCLISLMAHKLQFNIMEEDFYTNAKHSIGTSIDELKKYCNEEEMDTLNKLKSFVKKYL